MSDSTDETKSKLVIKEGIQYIEKSEKNADKRITCINNSSFLTSIDIYKNNAKLATWKNIAKGDMAIFNPASKIHLMYNETIKKGQIIEKYMINENQFKDIELNGVSFIDARLVYDPDQQGKKRNG
jgi:hypothetical protein